MPVLPPSRVRRPLIGVTACQRQLEDLPHHVTGDKYLRAVLDGAGGLPLLVPALGAPLAADEVADRLDGLLITGSPSNILPAHYGGAPSLPGTLHDPERDATTLPLIRAALAAGVPLLGICRGLQELNVALGGTLHQRVHELPGKHDHRWDDDESLEEQFGPAHPVRIRAGGLLDALLAGVRAPGAELTVNSLHWQGLDRLAPGLRVEAEAPDGLVEAVSLPAAPAFALAVQWHPEWRFAENPASRALLEGFGAAARVRAAGR
ncbi:MAG: gamma-glutamyl-gamma-aminobutyrate hydrolase family protein [Rhodospirillaceae bacterium]